MDHPPLANAELALMELLWQHSAGSTARELQEQLYREATRAQHGTVQRLLQRLEAKGYVARDRNAPVQRFTARIGREAYASAQLEALAARLSGGSLAPLITHLIEDRKISRAEIARLRRILDERREVGP